MWIMHKKKISTHYLLNIVPNGRNNTVLQKSIRMLYQVEEQMRR